MKKILVAVFLTGGLLLTGCGSATAETNGGASDIDYEAAKSSDVVLVEDSEAVEQETVQQEETALSVFAELPDKFIYSSGAGGWATELYLNDDGTFTGKYHDSDLGYTGADYPNGTVYISNYTGKFSEPRLVNEYTYSVTVEYIELEMEAGQEYYEDGTRYVTCGASELTDAGELLVYLPGAMRDDLPEEFLSWTSYGDFGVEQELRCYGIYNQTQQLAFIGYRYTPFEELQKLTGTFRNENGDEFRIEIYQDSDSQMDEIGSVYWTPHDGETLFGHVYKLTTGGFETALPESMVYYFDITNGDVNNTQFVGNEPYSAELGTFTRVE